EWLAASGNVDLMTIDVTHRIDEWRMLEVRVAEGEAPLPVHLAIGVVVHRRAVDVGRRQIDVVAGHCQLHRLCRSTHCEQESAPLDELSDLFRDVLLECWNIGEAEALRGGEILLHQLDEPGRLTIREIELVQLTGEVL